MATTQLQTGLFVESIFSDSAIRKHSILLNDSSDSDSNDNTNIANENIETISGERLASEFFGVFTNKFTNKDLGVRMQKLKLFREDGHMQSLARAVFDFSMDDKVRYNLLFETEGNLKLMWQFIFLSFMDQELLMLELKYKQHSEDFNRINNYQIEHGLIAKRMDPKCISSFQSVLFER